MKPTLDANDQNSVAESPPACEDHPPHIFDNFDKDLNVNGCHGTVRYDPGDGSFDTSQCQSPRRVHNVWRKQFIFCFVHQLKIFIFTLRLVSLRSCFVYTRQQRQHPTLNTTTTKVCETPQIHE